MALYVTVCLLAALTALQNVVAVPGRVLGLVWGTTIGLALAHLFAFRIAGRLVQDGRLAKGDQIEVIGSKIKYQDADALIAREVKKAGKVLTLRHARGFPVWSRRNR